MATTSTLSLAVPRPAHVPESLVYDFDIFLDPAYLADPHNRVLELHRKAPPIFWTPRQGGHWMLISHAANFEASRDWESFTSMLVSKSVAAQLHDMQPESGRHIPQPTPINIDPPDHAKYRAPLQGAFSPKAIAVLADDIRALARRLIQGVAADGRCDFMVEIAEPLPVQVFLKMMGLPLERQSEYRVLVREMLEMMDPSKPERSLINFQRIVDSMRDTMLARRAEPRDDLISLLWQSTVNGQPATMEDMENYAVLLFIAGLDTVMNGMGFGILHLARNPALQDQLRANPVLIPAALEELLRRYTFTVPMRRVAKDIQFQGVAMKEDDRVSLFLPGADLDAREFPEPAKFDLDRENNVHIAFNSGPHRCLGSHLARVELKILYEEMLAELPRFRSDPANPPTFHGGNVIGIDTLPIVWDV